jgi:RimJ/RimL family protein N-acetyltransferase
VVRVSTMDQIEITAMSADLVDSFHRAIDAVAREQKYLPILEALPVEAMRAFATNPIKPDALTFAALERGEVIGWCDVQRMMLRAFVHRGAVNMGVVAARRGRGVGFRLLDAAVRESFRRGLIRVELQVRSDNAPAIALYEKFGFLHEGVARDAFLVEGEYCDAFTMAIVRKPGCHDQNRD